MKKTENKDENPIFYRESIPLDYAKITELIIKDLNANTNPRNTNYNRGQISTYLANPARYAKNLQGMSAYLYNFSPHYRRLINYYAKMPTLDCYVEPYGIDFSKSINEKTFKNNFGKAVDLIELMNIKHEFGKALVSAWKLGTFYGYELYTKESYFIMELPYEYCQISGIMDGVFTFSFDMSYFERNADQIEMYPKEIISMFNGYVNGSKPRWQELDPAKTVCIKINEETYYDIPPFVGIFADIFDLEDYKSIRKTSTALGNYKFIVQKIPIREKSEKNNDFLVDLKTVQMFHNKTASLLPEEIGIFSSPFDIDTVEFKKDTTERDIVQDAEKSLYDGAGLSQQLFNGSKTSKADLAKSINVDEADIFLVLRQIERIVTGKIKNEIKGTFKFRLKILNNTVFNREKNTDTLLKNAQFGLPVKLMLGASLGFSPSSVQAMAYLENDVLGLSESFIPLSSSHTQSGNESDITDDGGRPEIDEEDLSEKGEEQRESNEEL